MQQHLTEEFRAYEERLEKYLRSPSATTGQTLVMLGDMQVWFERHDLRDTDEYLELVEVIDDVVLDLLELHPDTPEWNRRSAPRSANSPNGPPLGPSRRQIRRTGDM